MSLNLLQLVSLIALILPCALAQTPEKSDVKQWAQALSDAFNNITNNQLGADDLQGVYDQSQFNSFTRNGEQIIDQLQQQLDDLVKEKNQVVRDLESTLSESIQNYVREGDNPSYIDASDEQDLQQLDLKENPRFPKKVDVDKSVVKFAPGVSPENQAVKDMLFMTQELQPVFEDNLQKTTWQYFGSSEGFFHQYPGARWSKNDQGEFEQFDPRFRAWYVGASSGPKDVILLIDISGSMGQNNRINVAKEAALTVLNTLTTKDFVNVILFNGDAVVSQCFPSEIVRATPENLKKLKAFINETPHSGGTNFQAPFEKAFQMFQGSYSNGIGSQCESAILFMTDGQANDPTNIINQYQTNDLNVKIFSYALGADADQDIPRKVACDNQGIFFSIQDNASLRTQMGEYYRYFALGINTESTLWTAPYFDVNGLGLILTVALPVYDKRVSPPKLAGVLGSDIVVSELVSQAFSERAQDSYAFVVNKEGQVLTHPRLKSPSVYTSPPVYVDIGSLETDPAFDSVRTSMVSMESGQKTASIQRELPRGDVAYEGIRFQNLEVTYYWQAVPDAQFSICYVLAASDRQRVDWTTPDSYTDSYYHRIDLYPGIYSSELDIQSTNSENPLYYTNDVSTFKVAPKGFNNVFQYQQNKETEQDVIEYNEFVNGERTGNPGFVTSIRPSAQLSVSVASSVWKPQYDDSKLLWVYYGTDGGVWRAYPGHNTGKSYDPTRRPWYLRALNNPGKIAVSTPYADASFSTVGGSAKYVVTISKTIEEPTTNGKVAGVAGIDFLYKAFEDMLDEYAPGCADGDNMCALVDSSGLVVAHKGFGNNPATNVFMSNSTLGLTEWTDYLVQENFLENNTFNNFAELENIEYYTMNKDLREGKIPLIQQSFSSGSRCFRGNYFQAVLPNTNLFLVVANDNIKQGVNCQEIQPKVSPIDVCQETISLSSGSKCLDFELTDSMLEGLRGGSCSGLSSSGSGDTSSSASKTLVGFMSFVIITFLGVVFVL
eukprot:gb/GECH01010570.1/.p1 GENE.gb/GECH01010570.1/~~gb/GECH01010570.1/.p1  ORF type:complete len:1003 (+),score=253.65 gb/GECH01010570.1/:1-3009(+)